MTVDHERVTELQETLLETFGASDEPIDIASAPGRVNLIGGHTDYNEGFVLPAAIDYRTVVAIRPRDDETVAVRSTDFEETKTFSLDAIEPGAETSWVEYVKGVAERLADHGYGISGADLVVDGGVPMGAGLSSSAAFEVSVAEAFAAAAGESLGDELVPICWEAETQFVGVGCGIMDQYAAVHGDPESALFIDCRSEHHENISLPSADLAIVATDTNVQHDLVESAYNDRVATCREGVDHFDDALDRDVTSLRDLSLDVVDAHAAGLSDVARKRVRHVVSENERVQEAAAALREGDLQRVGDLLDASHASLRDDYEVSVDALDAVVSIAAERDGAFGSRMTGAGFGGSVVTLVRPDAVDDVADAIRREFPERTGHDPDVYVCNPDDGVQRHDVA